MSEISDLLELARSLHPYIEQAAAQQPTPEPTPEERIAALEQELAAAKILLGLEE